MAPRRFPTVCVRRATKRLLACTGAALTLAAIAAARAPAAIPAAPGGPILVVTSNGDSFGSYLPEILRGEGLNQFDVADIGSVAPQTLAAHDVVVLGHMSLSDAQVAMLSAWVQAGGNLVAMRPDKNLAGLLGLADGGGTRDEGNLTSVAGGVTGASMRFHGSADLYGLAGASPVARLDSGQPAVSLRDVGAAGGQAAAFTYDLARSVVYTRQGNPAWAGTERDGNAEAIRSDDMFFSGTQPDWVDLNRVQVPAADEQQRMLANLVIGMENDRMPLPRFWYLPRGLKAAVVLTGDDHNYAGQHGTTGQFNTYIADSPPGCSVALWQCVRSTSYVFPGATITNADAAAFQAQGFEVALHGWVSGNPSGQVSGDGNCHNFPSRASYADDLSLQLQLFRSTYPSLNAPATNRNHCIVYSDWSSVPNDELAQGIRLDTNYYYWPDAWVHDRPGFFTGSGFPQRFAETDGALIDVYQAATQLTDESGQDIPTEVGALLDNAIGPAGYYGVITANMHTDIAPHPGADAIVAAAQARGVPVVSARQMLTWLDGRNTSSFQGLAFGGGRLSFSVAQGAGATGLQAMLPASGPTGALQAIARDGQPVAFATQTIKGITYATFPADAGAYVATYPRARGERGDGRRRRRRARPARRQRASGPSRCSRGAPRRGPSRALKLSTPKLRPGGGRSLAITFRLEHTSRVVLTFRTTKGKIARRVRTPRRYQAGTVLRLRWDGRDTRATTSRPRATALPSPPPARATRRPREDPCASWPRRPEPQSTGAKRSTKVATTGRSSRRTSSPGTPGCPPARPRGRSPTA